jgi:hypothetical protein
MSAYNPSQTLQHKGHTEKPPFMDFLDKDATKGQPTKEDKAK